MMPGQTRSGQRPLHACGDILRVWSDAWTRAICSAGCRSSRACQPHLHVHRDFARGMKAPLRKNRRRRSSPNGCSLAIKSVWF